MSFIDDIQGQNTQLYPIVTIEPPDASDWGTQLSKCIFLSTNNVTLPMFLAKVEGSTSDPTLHSTNFKPLLLNIPSIKESMDIESRKFKISNVSLDISNIEYGGQRFTDILSDTSLINWKCSVQFVSPTGNGYSLIYSVVSDSHPNDISFYDKYKNDSDYKPFMTQMVYQGVIRRISHDDEKVRVELEDLTEQKAHKDLPSKSSGSGEDVPDKYKDKPIPMVYGHVDRSPLMFNELYNTSEQEFIADYNLIERIVENEELLIGVDGQYVRVLKNSVNHARWGYSKDSQFELLNEDTILISPIDNDESLLSEDAVEVEYTNKPNKIKLFTPEDDTYYTSGGITYYKEYEAENFGQEVEISQIRTDDDTFRKRYQIDYIFHDVIDPFIDDFLFNIHWDAELRYSSESLTDEVELLVELFGYIDEEDSPYVFNQVKANIFDFEGTAINGTDITHSNVSSFEDNWIDSTARKLKWRIAARLYGTDSTYYSEGANFSADCKLDINAFYSTVNYALKGFSTKDFYANVKGRINTFDDHPDEAIQATAGYMDYQTMDLPIVGTIEMPVWVSAVYELIENPIDIIYDLVRSELGHDAIDEAEYAEAKEEHDGWKFGFTVNKKINSKKLIEDIAKSTKCFPKFKNDGTFGFNTIKDSYDVANDYEDATQIRESEVLSYSFKKTKPEQIYKKVTVSYNKDYAQDSYLKTTGIDLGVDTHYGIEDSEDAHLELESDYIRNVQTTDKLASFLSEQYRNNHLTFNLKLPLQYIDLEIGDLVKFRELFGGVKAYGIDYRIIQYPNEQWYYPLFMVTSTTKNLDSVSIECMQLHNLTGVINLSWTRGVEELFPPQMNMGNNDPEGLFYFNDFDSLIVPEDIATDIVITPPNIIIDAPITTDIDTEEFTYDLHTHQATVIDGDQAGTDITDLLVVESMGQTFTGGQSHFVGEVDTDTNQIAVTYSITSPTTGLQSIQIFNYNINIRERQLPTVTVTPMAGADLGGDVWYSEILAEAGIQFEHYIKLADNMDANYWEKYVYNTSEFQEIQYSAVDNDNGEDLTNSVVLVAAGMINQLLLEGQGHQPYQHDPISIALSSWQSGNYLHLLEEGVPRYLTSTVMAFVWSDYGLYEYVKWHVRIELPHVEYGNFDLIPSGDINLDGVVDILDVVRVVNYVLADQEGSAPALFEEQLHQADITQDGTINVLDIVTLVNVIMEN
jgi:hypothetical protein